MKRKTCEWCWKGFLAKTANQKTCNQKCRVERARMLQHEYYLKYPEKFRTKKKVMSYEEESNKVAEILEEARKLSQWPIIEEDSLLLYTQPQRLFEYDTVIFQIDGNLVEIPVSKLISMVKIIEPCGGYKFCRIFIATHQQNARNNQHRNRTQDFFHWKINLGGKGIT